MFEIGTGSGLLAMMAARLGASSVTTCEAEPLLAATGKELIAANGLSAKIVAIPVDVRVGRVAVLRATHNRVCPWFVFEGFESGVGR